jgi:hypothetical protein
MVDGLFVKEQSIESEEDFKEAMELIFEDLVPKF